MSKDSIIEQLYWGNVNFDRYTIEQPSYRRTCERVARRQEQLAALLDEDGRKLLNEYCEAVNDREGLAVTCGMKAGFAFAWVVGVEAHAIAARFE